MRVLHLVGSAVSDIMVELSALYARDCLTSTADAAKYETHIAYVTPDLRWRFPEDLSGAAIASAPAMSLAEAITYLTGLNLDVVVPQMFCLPGMTSYRALFEVIGIAYVGNTPDVMALGANKAIAKAVVAAAGVPVPPGEVLRPGQCPTVAPPVVVKPINADNSVGISLVRQPTEFDEALKSGFAESGEVLIESFIELGREVRCGILERDGELICLPLEEYNVDSIRTRDDKIARTDDGDLRLVAKDSTRAWIVDIADPVTERVWDLAKACHLALGCRHYSLFDFRIDPDGQPWFLEAGLYSSFARQSVISVMAKAAGISVRELFDIALHEAISPH